MQGKFGTFICTDGFLLELEVHAFLVKDCLLLRMLHKHKDLPESCVVELTDAVYQMRVTDVHVINPRIRLEISTAQCIDAHLQSISCFGLGLVDRLKGCRFIHYYKHQLTADVYIAKS